MEKLLNIHEVMSDARAETASECEEMTTQTFRLPKRIKDLTDKISRTNGTNSSEFLRKCCETLVKDYQV